MDPNPYQNPSYFLIPNPPTSSSIDQDQDHQHRERDRFPQWTQPETKELITIRAELDRSFAETKRNKALWEAIATRMQHQGFTRTPEQCKSKWKNLVTRYKGSEAMEGDRSFPFREEMRDIFEERMERLLSLDKGKAKEKFKKRGKGGEVEEALREFGRKQMEMEMRWMEAAEAREAERRWKEEQWRREMAALEEERMEMERRWREREEERRVREEVRDEKRHAVITAILTKITEKESF